MPMRQPKLHSPTERKPFYIISAKIAILDIGDMWNGSAINSGSEQPESILKSLSEEFDQK
jgi:hypothetical protein